MSLSNSTLHLGPNIGIKSTSLILRGSRFWYYGNQAYIIKDGSDLVEEWSDRASSYDIIQVTTGQKPKYYDIEGVRFDGTDDELVYSGVDIFGSDTLGVIFFSGIFDYDTGHNCYIMSYHDQASNTKALYLGVMNTGKLRLYVNNGGTANVIESTTVIKTGLHYYGYIRSTGSSYEMNINGSNETLVITGGANNGNWFSSVTGSDNITLGSLKRLTPNYGKGFLREVHYSNEDLSTQELNNKLATLTPKVYGSTNCSYFFDNTDNHIDFGNILNSVYSGTQPQFSFRFVVNRISTGAGGYVLACKRQNLTGKKQFYFRFVGDELQLSFSADGTNEWREETTTLYADTSIWYDIVITFDGTQTGDDITRVYINGIENPMQATSGTRSGDIFATDSNLLLGRLQGSTNYYSGYHNMVGLTSDIITADEAFRLSNGGKPQPLSDVCDNIELDCIFDNDTWDGANFTVIDDSINGNDGTSVNMTAIDKDCNENPY